MFNKLLMVLLMGFLIIGGYVAYTAVTLPNVRKALEVGVEPSQTSQILARDKTLIMSYGKFHHKPVPLSQISPVLIEALIATEDRRFYQHQGVDPIGIARALVTNVKSHGVQEGGSTLTQQLARNIFLSQERSIQRKVKEALLALKLEQQLSKDEILELYLNNVYFGEGAYGVGAASNIYFGKSPKALSKSEAALLAGLPQAPSLYSPFSNPNLAKKRRDEVLENLVETEKITAAQANAISRQGLYLNPNGRGLSSSDRAPFFNRYVIREVQDILGLDEQAFWQQGLKVQTTLDPRAQAIAETQLRQLNNAYGRSRKAQQAALLSLDSRGGMIAYVGGKNFAVSQFDRVSQAHRPAGSLFKIFVYTTAIEQGVTPLTVFKDTPVQFGNWEPENYDKRHHGYMTVAKALVQSNNVIAVKLLQMLTPQAVAQTAKRMGVESQMQPNLSLALGAADVTLKEMTGAFSVFSQNGIYREPYAIESIVDKSGRILYQHSPDERQVLQRLPRDTMVAMMKGVVLYGTGRAALLGRDVAGKTGTSDDYRDAWFIGFTPEITTGVWVGNDDNSKMPGLTGGSLPARIWRAYMSRLLSGVPKRAFNLEFAMPIAEQDFFVYNLENLSSAEETLQPEEEAQIEEEPSEEGAEGENLEGDPQNLADPETYGGMEPPLSGVGQSEVPQPQVIAPSKTGMPVPSRPQSYPTPPVAPKVSPSNEDRFFDFKSQPSQNRYQQPSSYPSKPAPYNNTPTSSQQNVYPPPEAQAGASR